VLGFEDLPEVVFGKYDGVLIFCSMQRGEAGVDQIGAERKLWAVFLDDAERVRTYFEPS
jgi:hypothetical protein